MFFPAESSAVRPSSKIGNASATGHSYDEALALESMLYAREVPRHSVRQHVCGLRGAVRRYEINPRRAQGVAFEPPHLWPHGRGEARRSQWPHSQCRARDVGRRASGGHPPPRYRPQGALRQSWVYRELDSWTEEESRPGARLSRPPRSDPNSPAVSSGVKPRWPSGTTARLGTSPSTTITANAASCTASRSQAKSWAEPQNGGIREAPTGARDSRARSRRATPPSKSARVPHRR